jgi:glycerol-3-phosphate dehydrogenase
VLACFSHPFTVNEPQGDEKAPSYVPQQSRGIQTEVTSGPIRASLEGEQFEIVVIGGGINGVAIARELARAGKRVLLLEQNDFASGTTSRSTRIIHGGLRYLQYAEIGLVRESLRERERLIRERPHLVRPLRFVLALDRNSRPSALQIRTGLWLYGKLAGHRRLPENHKKATRELEAQLDSERQWSIFEYDDAQCEFPERLVAEWLMEAASAGATVWNYATALEVLQSQGRVTGVLCRDRLSGEKEFTVKCAWVINATGPWVDQVCAEASIPTGGPLIGGVRGSHLVLPRFTGAPEIALYTQAFDGRAIFVLPWNKQILLGTTEISDSSDPAAVEPSAGEIEYLLRCANAIFPKAELTALDIHYAFAGIRPLPYVKGASPSAITRKSILYDHKLDGIEGMISVIGGKLTTAASLARKCAQALGVHTKPVADTVVPVGGGIETAVRDWARAMSRETGLSEDFARQTANMYGPSALSVLRLAATDQRLLETLCPHTRHAVAEAVFALRFEFAATVADVLLRRVPVALGPCWSAECTRTAACRVGTALGWDEEEIEWQVETVETERAAFLKKPVVHQRFSDASPPSYRPV